MMTFRSALVSGPDRDTPRISQIKLDEWLLMRYNGFVVDKQAPSVRSFRVLPKAGRTPDSLDSFRICASQKRTSNFLRINTYDSRQDLHKTNDLKSLVINTYAPYANSRDNSSRINIFEENEGVDWTPRSVSYPPGGLRA
jgi:hypothetical protein